MRELDKTIERAIEGNPEAFEELCNVKGRSILYLCIKSMGNVHDGEDAAQEVFIRIQNKIFSLKSPFAFDRWVYLIIQSTCNNLRRKNMRSNESLPIEDYEEVILNKDIDSIPQEFVEDDEKRQSLLKIIDEMPYNMRMCVILFYYEELPQAEIAKILSITVPTVKTFLYRAKARIKKSVTKLEPEYESKKNVMSMILLKEFLQADATATTTKEAIKQCISPAITKAFEASSVVAPVVMTQAGIAGVITAGISIVAVSVWLTVVIASGKDVNISNSGFIHNNEYAPQHIEQSEQSALENILSPESIFLSDSSQLVESESVPAAVEEGEEDVDIGLTDGASTKYDIHGQVLVQGKDGSTLQTSAFSMQNIKVAIMKNGVTIAQTSTNPNGEYLFAGQDLPKGEYQIKSISNFNHLIGFSNENSTGIVSIFAEDEGLIVAQTIYIIKDVSPSVALVLYDAKENRTMTNPTRVKIKIGNLIETEYVLQIYKTDSTELVIAGNENEINEFLQSSPKVGAYTLKAMVTDVSGNETVEQTNFYIV